MKYNVTLIVILLLGRFTNAQTFGTITDSRDGKTYKTVTYAMDLSGGVTYPMTWMAENLNYKTDGSWCYSNQPEYCNGHGLLYNWAAAMEACPGGWHLPSDEEWDKLVEQTGGDTAGNALKSTSGWHKNAHGTNSSGFNGLPAGFRYNNGKFDNSGVNSLFWSSTVKDDENAWSRILYFNYSQVYRDYYDKELAYSCRCVLD